MAEQHARGLRTDFKRRQFPDVGAAFDIYLSCRQQQLFHMEVQKDKGRRVEHKVLPWTTGYALPEPGGMLDQPAWMTDMFDFFVQGERAAMMKELKK